MASQLQNTLLSALLRQQQQQQNLLLDERARGEEQKRYDQSREDIMFERLSKDRELQEAARDKEFERKFKVADLMGKQDEIRMRLSKDGSYTPPKRDFGGVDSLREIYETGRGGGAASYAQMIEAQQAKQRLETHKGGVRQGQDRAKQERDFRMQMGLGEFGEGRGTIEEKEYQQLQYTERLINKGINPKTGRPISDDLRFPVLKRTWATVIASSGTGQAGAVVGEPRTQARAGLLGLLLQARYMIEQGASEEEATQIVTSQPKWNEWARTLGMPTYGLGEASTELVSPWQAAQQMRTGGVPVSVNQAATTIPKPERNQFPTEEAYKDAVRRHAAALEMD